MEEIELYIIKNEIIKIGDKEIDSDDIFELSKRILKSRTNQCIDTLLECIFYMPVKIGIYATILGIITKGNDKLKLQLILKLNHNISVFVKSNSYHCLLWFRCIIGLSCCGVFDFSHCIKLFKDLYALCVELYNENKYIKADNILYLFLSNFFYISKQIYDENKAELDNILSICFDLIDKRQACIDNIDIDNNDLTTIEYIYIYINSVKHSDNFNDRLFYLKEALHHYIENNLRSVATHRFYQKEIFQNVFLKDQNDQNMLSENQNNRAELETGIENCISIQHFINYDCIDCIASLQIKFITKYSDDKNIHDIWLMQEHIIYIIELYKNSVEFSSKILGIYVQLQSKLYNNVLVECIINKLLSSFNNKNYYFYISLMHRLLLINKNLGSVIIRCIKFVLSQIGELDNESFYLFMELCLYILSSFAYEHKILKSKENFFKRRYNDMNKILKAKGENQNEENQLEGNDDNTEGINNDDIKNEEGGLNASSNNKTKRKRKIDELEVNDINLNSESENEGKMEDDNILQNEMKQKRNPVILKKNEITLNRTKSYDNKIPYCIELDLKCSSDESSDGEETKKNKNNDEENIYDENDEYDEENNEDDNQNDNNNHPFNFESFKEEIEKLDAGENFKKITKLMYSVKKKYRRKWVRNFYFKSHSLIYKKECDNLVPKTIIDYCNSFKLTSDNTYENFNEYFIFNSIIKYCIEEIDNIEDKEYDMDNDVDGFNNADNYNKSKYDSINKLKDTINALIQSFINYINTKNYLCNVPNFFKGLSKNINFLKDISSANLDGQFFDNYIFKEDFLNNSNCWDSYSILILFLKSLMFFDSSNVSSLKKAFKNHAVIFLSYKNSGIFKTEDEQMQFEVELLYIVYTYFNNSALLNVIVNILIENKIVKEMSVLYFIFHKLDGSNLDEYYIVQLLYEGVNNLIIKKENNENERNKLRRRKTESENENLINELEGEKNEIVNKIFHLTNQTIIMISEKMMKLKNDNNSYMSKELLKESLVFLRTYIEYIDIDQFLQQCHEKGFASEQQELATIFKYASLKMKAQ
ncbi:conserved Plasmodium protein, unknown function [Plasmodium chabaudi chabaudi]|uniref:Uncharacterized protein n=1 Tax=Plasmodium chabaudi chabaudi TaxID=31271 RepID=A0A1C6YLM4_PLACU|nr:conserved Plasmodium protein, unknown function [Plasmodium chabaudi chabaudi]